MGSQQEGPLNKYTPALSDPILDMLLPLGPQQQRPTPLLVDSARYKMLAFISSQAD